jgi:hypothetical protein
MLGQWAAHTMELAYITCIVSQMTAACYGIWPHMYVHIYW